MFFAVAKQSRVFIFLYQIKKDCVSCWWNHTVMQTIPTPCLLIDLKFLLYSVLLHFVAILTLLFIPFWTAKVMTLPCFIHSWMFKCNLQISLKCPTHSHQVCAAVCLKIYPHRFRLSCFAKSMMYKLRDTKQSISNLVICAGSVIFSMPCASIKFFPYFQEDPPNVSHF